MDEEEQPEDTLFQCIMTLILSLPQTPARNETNFLSRQDKRAITTLAMNSSIRAVEEAIENLWDEETGDSYPLKSEEERLVLINLLKEVQGQY